MRNAFPSETRGEKFVSRVWNDARNVSFLLFLERMAEMRPSLVSRDTKDSFGPSTGIYECRSSKAISDLFVAAFSTTIPSNFPPLTHANFFHTGTFVYAPNSPRQYV